MRWMLIALIAIWLLVAGCNVAKDTKDTAQQGENGAVGLAEKMKGGTVGGADEDTGDSEGEDSGD